MCTAEGASKRQPSPFTLLGNRRFLTLIHAIYELQVLIVNLKTDNVHEQISVHIFTLH